MKFEQFLEKVETKENAISMLQHIQRRLAEEVDEDVWKHIAPNFTSHLHVLFHSISHAVDASHVRRNL